MKIVRLANSVNLLKRTIYVLLYRGMDYVLSKY